MKLTRNLTTYHVKAATVNMKTGQVMSKIFIVHTNGFMFIRDSLKVQLDRNERIEHVEVL